MFFLNFLDFFAIFAVFLGWGGEVVDFWGGFWGGFWGRVFGAGVFWGGVGFLGRAGVFGGFGGLGGFWGVMGLGAMGGGWGLGRRVAPSMAGKCRGPSFPQSVKRESRVFCFLLLRDGSIKDAGFRIGEEYSRYASLFLYRTE